MSFNCEECGEHGFKPTRVVVETAPIVYPEREYKSNRREIDRNKKWIKDPGGVGTQIVREKNMCGLCAVKFSNHNHEQLQKIDSIVAELRGKKLHGASTNELTYFGKQLSDGLKRGINPDQMIQVLA